MLFYREHFLRSRRHKHYIFPVHFLLSSYFDMTLLLKGFCMHVVGPVDKHARSKTISKTLGSIQVSTLTAEIDYYCFQVPTVFGCLGFKFWLSYRLE